MPVKDPCKVFACKIQDCLKENKFQEPSCQRILEQMRDCCRKWKDKSLVCEGIDISDKPDPK
ncbi:hypothetical protein NQ317_001533 [Molorchus minor]|uniref:Cx9C motif-containing protein 4 n=1 Tax=Molorchus minor TaxID=1323400 RepID=A0ABQ9J8S0_9CUCU|nr:hypothetical protein NQ317_001533 [Molorchus minor]